MRLYFYVIIYIIIIFFHIYKYINKIGNNSFNNVNLALIKIVNLFFELKWYFLVLVDQLSYNNLLRA